MGAGAGRERVDGNHTVVDGERAAPPASAAEVSVLFTEEEVDSAVDCLASVLAVNRGKKPVRLVTVLDGGRWLGDRIAAALADDGLDADQQGVRVERSAGSALRGPPVVDPDFERRVLPTLAGGEVVLVDDICDEGQTLRALDALLEPVAARVRSAVLVRRIRPDNVTAYLPTWSALETRHSGWLVGCGMDSEGRYRDLPYVGVIESGDSGA